MEAIAAAGALPGLASATIQLGTATFQFYQQLHSLYKAIKHGENDLNTAVRRLDQHGDFIKELRFNFERISGPGVSTGTRDLFESYITDSEAEVEEFRNLLSGIGKQHFKIKSLQAVETGSRLRFHERSIQKYCDLLDKQMQRFLFLQSSVQSIRIESTLSEVIDTLVEQGAKAAAFYDEHSPREIGEELHTQSGTRSNELQLPLRRADRSSHTAPSLRCDVIPSQWDVTQFKRYPTLCGTVTVTKVWDSRTYNAPNHQFAYKVRFEPYGWISRTLVEWRYLIGSMHTVPMLMLSVTTSIICEDPDVIDALGFIMHTGLPSLSSRYVSSFCRPKMPNPSKVRALLDAGRLLKEHVVYGPRSWSHTDILTACFEYLACYDHKLKISEHSCCSLWDSATLLRYYREFYDVIELLLSRGFEPNLSSWQSIYCYAVSYRWRISHDHPALISAITLTYKSISTLISKTYGHSIPFNVLSTSMEELSICSRQLFDIGASLCHGHYIQGASLVGSSHLGHLIALQFRADMIIREIPDLDLLDFADEQLMLDRWILGLFAPHRPEIALLLQQYLKSYKTTAVYKRFEVEYICKEFKQCTKGPIANQRLCLLKFICLHGNATILQQLDLTTLSDWEMNSMLQCASQKSAQDIFSILTSYIKRTPQFMLLHTKMMRQRLTDDSVFLRNFIALLKTHSEPELLSEFFRDDFSGSVLFATDSYPLPAYMRNFIVGLVERYETHPTTIEWAVHSLIYSAMINHWKTGKSAERLLQNLHFYYFLNLVANSSAFKPSLDLSSPKDVNLFYFGALQLYPSVNGYSPLMLALHCGMRPAVQILADAGASILTPSNCGKSPLSVAYEYTRAQHPRQWIVKYGTSGLDGTEWRGSTTRNHEPMWISESTDKEMLEILLQALRDRGEAVEEGLDELPMRSKWEILKQKTHHFAEWLFKPSYTFDPDTFRENSTYAILVSTLWFLSILKVLKAELGDYPTHIASLLSRPAVILTLVVLIVSILR
ncbi:hypothetical protein F4679DRAFT_542553 [Xylaria curta]|nr:hypothetical protein F4679DRAFT_542553 [Xylaria curta]